ncbi:DEAD/DEAH box helicase [Paraconexibacter sp.]|uniref:DEAD/DEAH box helicase n=1 Tax=Paraconexibacter sp. TaxID=2949640 RepID=UPI003563D9C9
MTTFADLGLSETCIRAMSDAGITSPFPVQAAVIPDALRGEDVLVQSPTGSGKTIAFGLPLVEMIEATDRRASAVVLAPTRELASQIVEDILPIAHARALSVAAVYGGVGIVAQAKRAAKAHIIVATPGRLIDLLERGDVNLRHVKIAVLDEADRMLDMGFKPAVDRILREVPSSRQMLFFSATLDGAPRKFADSFTTNAIEHKLAAPVSQRSAEIEHRFMAVPHPDKIDSLVHTLHNEERGLAVVFVRTKRGADRLVKRLGNSGVNAVAMHGDKSQSQREKALARFESGSVDTLVATDVAARGLDVRDVTHVINFDAPEDREAYVHRAGRTGRAGRSGVAITLVSPDQHKDISLIARDLRLDRELAGAGITATNGGPSLPKPQRGGGGQRPGGSGQRSGGGSSRNRKGSSAGRSGAGSGNGSAKGGVTFSGGSFGPGSGGGSRRSGGGRRSSAR